MEIKRLIRKNRTIQEDDSRIFHSFKEVFDYCYEELKKYVNQKKYDVIVFNFRILDTNEQFEVAGGTKESKITKETYVYADISFDSLARINMKEYELEFKAAETN